MAQHFKIEEWKDQEWFPKIMREIERGVKFLKNCEAEKLEWKKYSSIGNSEWLFLPTDEYKMKDDTARVLGYRPTKRFDMALAPDEEIHVDHCNFEIHVDKDNKIQQVYLPL
jgi:hypothetical protein